MENKKINDNIPEILSAYKRIAVVGISNKPERDSADVARYMMKKNYQVYPVNPNYKEVLGLTCYPTLLDIPEPVDLIDIFRRSEEVEAIVDQAIQIGAKAVWMQMGVINRVAAQKALDAGLEVVMNRCWKRDFQAFLG